MSDNSKTTITHLGTSAIGVLQIIFIVLKLTKNEVIGEWPWWKVMLPFICSAGLACCLCNTTLCLILCCKKEGSKNNIVFEEYAIPVTTKKPLEVDNSIV